MLFIQIALQIRKTWRKKNKKHAVRCHGEVTKVRLAYWRSESNLYSERLIIKVPDSTPRRNPGCVYRLDRDRRWLIFSLLCQGLSFFRKRSAGRVLFISFPSSAHVPDDIPDLASGLSSSSCRVCTPVYSCGFVAGPWELFDFFFFPPKKKKFPQKSAIDSVGISRQPGALSFTGSWDTFWSETGVWVKLSSENPWGLSIFSACTTSLNGKENPTNRHVLRLPRVLGFLKRFYMGFLLKGRTRLKHL